MVEYAYHQSKEFLYSFRKGIDRLKCENFYRREERFADDETK